jgi:hypothetical protein
MSTEHTLPPPLVETKWGLFKKYLNAVLQKLNNSEEKKSTQSSLGVTEIKHPDFQRLYDQLKDKHPKVSMGNWKKVSEDEVIINQGAGPCIIIYFHDATNKEILCGHYPYTTIQEPDFVIRNQMQKSSEALKEENPQGIEVPNADQMRKMPPPLGEIVTSYNELMAEVNTRKKDGAKIEAYYFGQNVGLVKPEKIPEIKDYEKFITDVLIQWNRRRLAPVNDAQKAGIMLEHIHDFRPPMTYEGAQTDHTAYIPGKGIVYTRGDGLKS